jgi:hypothetical protein
MVISAIGVPRLSKPLLPRFRDQYTNSVADTKRALNLLNLHPAKKQFSSQQVLEKVPAVLPMDPVLLCGLPAFYIKIIIV